MRYLILILLLVGCSEIVYDEEYSLEPDYVLKAAGLGVEDYTSGIDEPLKDAWAEGDRQLILARLTNSTEHYQKACTSWKGYSPRSREAKALRYETLWSTCGRSKWHLFWAKWHWRWLGVSWRAELLDQIPNNETVITFDTTSIKARLDLKDAEEVVIGSTTITVDKNTKILTQVDRVYRDWLGRQIGSPFEGEYLVTFSERLTYNETSLRSDIGWHEGGRLRDLAKIGIDSRVATGTLIAKVRGKWYAPDERGIFRFEVPLDKVSYPTTRFFTEDLGMVIDTHGVNMLVEQAIRNEVDVVLSDCDNVGKVKAAKHLSKQGVKVVCFPDRFVHEALGHGIDLVGSPTWRLEGDKMVYGGSPLTIYRGQRIVVTDADLGKTYALWYYTTPRFYFNEINKTFPLDIYYVVLDGFEETDKVYSLARRKGIDLIASRVFTEYDYNQARQWLSESTHNRLILFHSTMYPYGILTMQEFPEQVSFNDPNPVIAE